MAVHLLDSTLFGNAIGTPAMRMIFEERAMLQAWLDVEAALAEAQASLGVIPAEASEVIASRADISRIDLNAVQSHGARTGHSLMGLLQEFRGVIDHDHSRYVHFGATTQDIIDTGLMLMVKQAYGLVLESLVRVMTDLARLTETHADTVMVGRTHGGHGLPITFGFKTAIWLSEFQRQLERWAEARERVLVGNLTGAVGTFASWGENGPEIQRKTLRILGLGVPDTVWHSSRDRVAELAILCALLAGTCCRIAREIYNLSRTEFGELQEPSDGKVGSSTMPHKRNPIHSEWIMVLERSIRANATVCLEAMGQENEWDASRWKNEWIAIPESFVMLSGILSHMEILMRGVTVLESRMRRNLSLLRGMLLSEPVMFLLEKTFPLPIAHEKVYRASVKASEKETNFLDELMEDEEVRSRFRREDIEAVLEPSRYVGLAPLVAREVKAKVERRVKEVLSIQAAKRRFESEGTAA